MQEDSDPSGKPRPTEAGRSVPQEKWRLRRDGGAGDMEVQEIWRLRRDGGAGSRKKGTEIQSRSWQREKVQEPL